MSDDLPERWPTLAELFRAGHFADLDPRFSVLLEEFGSDYRTAYDTARGFSLFLVIAALTGNERREKPGEGDSGTQSDRCAADAIRSALRATEVRANADAAIDEPSLSVRRSLATVGDPGLAREIAAFGNDYKRGLAEASDPALVVLATLLGLDIGTLRGLLPFGSGAGEMEAWVRARIPYETLPVVRRRISIDGER